MIPFYLFVVKFRKCQVLYFTDDQENVRRKPECQISDLTIVQDHIIEYLFS